jgi:Tol biopolymer transport system component
MRTRASFALLAVVVLAAVGLAGAASGSPAVAKHGTQLVVFVAPRAGTVGERLEVVDRRGHVLRVLSKAHYGTVGRWSPNDASIAWLDPAGIHVEGADGSNPRLLVPACQSCSPLSLTWSPDSRALAVGSAGANGNQLQLVPIDGSAPTLLVSSTDAKRVFTPAWWTADGKSLVYTESRSVAITGASMRELTPATRKTVTLWSTPTAQGFNAPMISPDLRYWSYIKELDQYHQQVRIIDKSTGRTHIVYGINSTNLDGWSPDSKAFGITASGGHIVTVSPTGTVQHQLGPGDQFVWGRNSNELFVLRGKSTQIFASENGHASRLLFQLPKRDWLVSLDAN